ncbi:MAG: alkaline phosphatase [bacterium]
MIRLRLMVFSFVLLSVVGLAQPPADLSGLDQRGENPRPAPAGFGPGKAKSVVLFIADGTGIASLTAARIYKVGVSGDLNVDRFPYTAFCRTYSADGMVTDSAAAATALATGYKTNNGVLGQDVRATSDTEGKPLKTALEVAQDLGKSVGLVTTTRVTHATPAGFYAKLQARDEETGIAEQFLGKKITVLLGGGRSEFTPTTVKDPETSAGGKRSDGRDLTDEAQREGYVYVWNEEQFRAADPEKTEYLLGLFEAEHMEYELDRPKDKAGEPSLAEMTEKALQMLAKNPRGFFLMVEGGKIDHAAHGNLGAHHIADTLAFDDAIGKAVQMCGDTAIILVTADHECGGLAINGYSPRTVQGDALLGVAATGGMTGKSILSWASGRGHDSDPTKASADSSYLQPSAIQTSGASHTGTDVFLMATGPGAEVVHGFWDNTDIGKFIIATLKANPR